MFCKSKHFNDSSDKHVDVINRRKQLKNKGNVLFFLELVICPNVSLKYCFHCKKVGHNRSNCPTRCERSSVSYSQDTTVNLSSSEDNHPPESEQKSKETVSILSNTLLAGGERVLLQTAQVIVCGAD